MFSLPRSGNDFLEVHSDALEEVLGQIAAMEADGLIGIVAVVVVPIEQGARGAGRKRPVRTSQTVPQTSTSQALGQRGRCSSCS